MLAATKGSLTRRHPGVPRGEPETGSSKSDELGTRTSVVPPSVGSRTRSLTRINGAAMMAEDAEEEIPPLPLPRVPGSAESFWERDESGARLSGVELRVASRAMADPVPLVADAVRAWRLAASTSPRRSLSTMMRASLSSMSAAKRRSAWRRRRADWTAEAERTWPVWGSPSSSQHVGEEKGLWHSSQRRSGCSCPRAIVVSAEEEELPVVDFVFGLCCC